MAGLSINPSLDLFSLAADYAHRRRVRIPAFLDGDGLKAVHAALIRRDDWRQLFIGDGGIVQRDRAERDAGNAEQEKLLDDRIHERACLGFQYRYDGIRIPDAEENAVEDSLSVVGEFMASPPLLAALTAIVGHTGLRFGEGQATAYSAGDFLTCHDDAVDGRDRIAAFVLGITPSWRPEWGGLLMFHADDDSTLEAHVPQFNTLDLFAVPQRHSVSYVSPSAPGRRLALTGWLRASG